MTPHERPSIPGIEMPALPLPWEWSKRMDIINGVGLTAIMSGNLIDQEDRSELGELLEYARNRYIIPGKASAAIRDVVNFSNPLSETIFTAHSDQEYTAMMQRFEQEFLGLEPTSSTDGLRWWESSAGFSSGNYPTESIANLFDLSSDELLTYIKENKAGMGWVTIRASDWIIPVVDNHLSDGTVIIDGVNELTPLGQEYVESILKAYERGLKDGA